MFAQVRPRRLFINDDSEGLIPSNRTAEKDTRAADDGYYPGLVNMSGTYCFMNSVVQVGLGLTLR